jgi:hypothetical protein
MEALDFAVCAWPVGLDREVADACVCEQLVEYAAVDVGEGVVGHHALG